MSPTLENTVNCSKLSMDLDKTYRNAANTPSLHVSRLNKKVDNKKKAGHHNSLKPITVGPWIQITHN